MNVALPEFDKTKSEEDKPLTLPPDEHTCIVAVNDTITSAWLLFDLITSSDYMDDLFYIFSVSDNKEDELHTTVLEFVKEMLKYNPARYKEKFWVIDIQKGKDQTIFEAIDEAIKSMFKSYRFDNLHIFYGYTKESEYSVPWKASNYSKYVINRLSPYNYNTIVRWCIRYKPELAKLAKINKECNCCGECKECKMLLSDLQIKYNLTKDESIRTNIREFTKDKFGFEMGYVDNLAFAGDGMAINPEVYGKKSPPKKIDYRRILSQKQKPE